MIRLQYLVIISVLLHSKFTRGFPRLLQNGIEIVKYGEPCYSSQYLPVKIEEPIQKIPETNSPLETLACLSSYQPLKLNYQTISYEPPIISEPQREYSVFVENVPRVSVDCAKTLIAPPDLLRGKSYRYNIQTLSQIESSPVTATYNFDLQVPPSSPCPSESSALTEKSIKLLTGLTSRIDKVLVPACEVPLSSCSCRE